MKPSHFSAPRQLSDCAFTPSADPIERPSRRADIEDIVILAVGLPLMLVVLTAVGMGWL